MLTNRFSLIIPLATVAALALFTVSMVAFPRPSVSMSAADQAELQRAQSYIMNADRSYEQIELQRADNSAAASARQAYLDQRHGEQTIGAAIDFQVASQSFRQAEQAAALADAARAYQEYRQGERTAGNAAYSSTFLSSAAQAYLDYRRGEWSGK